MELNEHLTDDGANGHFTNERVRPNVSIDEVPTKRLGPLPEYDGDISTIDSWISQARAKLEIDYSTCSDRTKFWALHNRLRDKAIRQLQPWITAVQSDPHLATPAGLLWQLKLSFGDPQAKEKAIRALHALKQGRKLFMEHYTDFRRLLLEAGGTYWPDDIKKSFLEDSLNHDLAQKMIGLARPGISFDNYCQELKSVSDQMGALRIRTQYETRYQNPTFPNNKHQEADTMDWQRTPVLSTNMQKETRIAKWVSKDEIEKRKANRQCIRCGGTGHIIRSCPFKPAKQPVQMASVAVQPLLEETEPKEDF